MSASPPAICGHGASFLPYTNSTKPIPLGIRLKNSHVGSSDMLCLSSALFGVRLFSVRGGMGSLHDQFAGTLTEGFHVCGTWEWCKTDWREVAEESSAPRYATARR